MQPTRRSTGRDASRQSHSLQDHLFCLCFVRAFLFNPLRSPLSSISNSFHWWTFSSLFLSLHHFDNWDAPTAQFGQLKHDMKGLRLKFSFCDAFCYIQLCRSNVVSSPGKWWERGLILKYSLKSDVQKKKGWVVFQMWRYTWPSIQVEWLLCFHFLLRLESIMGGGGGSFQSVPHKFSSLHVLEPRWCLSRAEEVAPNVLNFTSSGRKIKACSTSVSIHVRMVKNIYISHAL